MINGETIQVDIRNNTLKYAGNGDKETTANDIIERPDYIKTIEEQNKKLNEIAWMQSHMVRAPLARIMGLISLITDFEQDNIEKEKILEYIMLSANELDAVIREISDKTRAVNY